MGTRTYTAILLFVSGTLAWASPKRTTALDQQFASIKAQHESVQRQSTAARAMRFKPIVISPPAPIARSIASSSPAPMTTFVSALEPMAPLLAAPQLDCPPIADEEADQLINTAALQQALSPALLRSVIKHESGFRPCAVSPKGAQGLMQLMPATAEQFGITNPFDPRQNIGGGAALLRQLLDRYSGDLKLALSAYNAGIGRVDASGGVPNLLETQNYVSGILEDLGMNDENKAAEQEPATEPDSPKKEDFHHITLQLSLGGKEGKKSSIQLAIGN